MAGRARLGLALAVLLLTPMQAIARSTDEVDPHTLPVRVVANDRVAVSGPEGSGLFPVYLSADWSRPAPSIKRAILVFHGLLRDADTYLKAAEAARAAAGPAGEDTLLIVPQFLADMDIRAHQLPPETLRWGRATWMGGEPAHGPAPLSSFQAIDAILMRLAEPGLFPALTHVILAGHSGGGQVVQRYAVVGRAGDVLAGRGIAVRYVVANPSSYVYFSTDRPLAAGGSGPFDAAACPAFNRWKYGFEAPPPYVGAADPAAFESRYIKRDVVYLLGSADIDPNHPVLDKTCEGEAEGPFRLARGQAYFDYLKRRDAGLLLHHLYEVPGVAHNGARMLGSACGLAALFDLPGCDASPP